MTVDLDTLARSAAADLRRRSETTDTEAALATLHRSTGTGRHRLRRLVPSGRTLAFVAAAVVLLAALAFAVGTRDGDDTQRLGTETTVPIDPTSFGPLLGTLHGSDDAGLTAEVYGPETVEDGSKVAVSITGARPGQHYAVTQCATGTADFHPAANCVGWGDLVVGEDGSVAGAFEAWAVFGAGSAPFTTDCRGVLCEVQISPLVEEDQPDDGLPGTRFAPRTPEDEAEGRPGSVVLPLADDAEAPPIPRMEATLVERVDDGMRVGIEATDLAPGRYDLVANGYLYPPTGMLAHLMGSAQKVVAAVEVGADGRLATTVTLPDALQDISETTVDGVVQDPEIVACGVDTSTCDIWLIPSATASGAAPSSTGRGILVPRPVPYPAEAD